MPATWTPEKIKKLIQALDNENVLAAVEDVFWVLEVITDPDADVKYKENFYDDEGKYHGHITEYFESLAS